MTRYFLGFDVGATKSHALVGDETGQALGFGEGGPGNPMDIDYHAFAELLSALTQEALVSAGVDDNDIAGVGFGIGGYDWPSQHGPILQAIRPLAQRAPFEIVNDAIIALLAGAS